MKSAGNRGVVHDHLQVLHVHVLLVAPPGTCHMAKAGTDQHQGGVAIGECPHHTGASADLYWRPAEIAPRARQEKLIAGQKKKPLRNSFKSFILNSDQTTQYFILWVHQEKEVKY